MTSKISDKQPSQLPSVKPNPYPGGRLAIEIYKEDTQRDLVYRGLYKHTEAATLPHEERLKFAEKWIADKFLHHIDGKMRPYTAKEFADLKKKGVANFDLDEKYSLNILTDLRQRQVSLNSQNSVQNSMSAPQYNEAEKAVKWMTDSIQ